MSGVYGYVKYNPTPEKRYWLECSARVLLEYKDELPLTVRQVFYRLVANFEYSKTEKAYGQLAHMLTRARRASLLEDPGTTVKIPFGALRDDKLRSRQALTYEGPEEFRESIRESADTYALDRQVGQEQHVEMWCEAQGMMPVLSGIAEPYTIRVSSSGGYDSITTKHDLAVRIARRAKEEELPTLLLHVGDFDGSGEDMFMNLEKDVGTMVMQLTGARRRKWFNCERVALTAEQVIERNVITAPPKPSDSRSAAFVERNWNVVDWAGHEDISAQLEALTPTDLRELFEEVITGHLDMDAYQRQLNLEERQRNAFGDLLRDLDLGIGEDEDDDS